MTELLEQDIVATSDSTDDDHLAHIPDVSCRFTLCGKPISEDEILGTEETYSDRDKCIVCLDLHGKLSRKDRATISQWFLEQGRRAW